MTRILTRPIALGRWRVHLEFKANDLWVGVYWCDHGGWVDVWVCLLPCLPIHAYTVERLPTPAHVGEAARG